MIKLARTDHRLVHGQVAFAWTGHLNITRIIVIDDASAGDELKKMTINMAKPVGVKLNIFSISEAIERMPKILDLKDSVMMVFGTVHDAAEVLSGHPVVKELNLGGIMKKEKSVQYGSAVYLDETEKSELKKLQDKGIKLFVQQVPNDPVKNITL